MRLERARAEDGPVIAGLAPGGFRVDGGVYPALWLTPRRAELWRDPPALAMLEAAALAPLMAVDPRPEFLLLGTGKALVRPPAPLVAALESMELGIEAMDSRAAARVWNVLRAEGRWIVAALYPLA